MSRGRPKGSKNKPKPDQKSKSNSSIKPSIEITTNDTEKSLISKIRTAYRESGRYGKSVMIGKTIWESGSLESDDIQLAINAAKKLVTIKE